jgi:hypothetical protein
MTSGLTQEFIHPRAHTELWVNNDALLARGFLVFKEATDVNLLLHGFIAERRELLFGSRAQLHPISVVPTQVAI